MRSRSHLAASLLITLLLAGCEGGADEGTHKAAQPSVSPTAERVAPSSGPAAGERAGGKELVSAKVIDTDFKPVELLIRAGSTVDWIQFGDQPHSVSAVDGSFDSSPGCGPLDPDGCLSEGDAFSFTFEKPGKFAYYCRVHGLPDGTGMFGTVIVN